MIKEFHVSKNLLNPDSKTTNQTGDERWGGEFAAGTYYVLNNTSGNIFWRDGVSSSGSSPIASGAGTVVTVQNALVVWHSSRDVKIMVADSSVAVPFEPYGDTWNTKSYAKSITGAQTYTKFPIVLRTTEQSIPIWSMDGNTETSGNPSLSNPVDVQGVGERTANLLPPPTAAASGEINGITYNVSADGVCTFSGTASASVNITVDLSEQFVIPYSTPAGGQGTVAFNNTKALNAVVMFYNGNTQVDAWQLNVVNRTHTSYSGMSGKTINKYIIQFASGVNADGLSVAVAFSDNGVPVSPFEPCGQYKISIVSNQTELTPVYLTEQLREIGDTADNIVSSGTANRLTYKYEFKGTELWSLGTNQMFISQNNLQDIPAPLAASALICSHFPNDNTGIINGNAWFFQVYGYSAVASDVATWQQYLAQQYTNGTPVTVWYILATPTTETVTVPTIPTTSGLNTIDVDTSVKPSKMSLTYDGYKICKPKRKSENIYDKHNVVTLTIGDRYGIYCSKGTYSIYNDTDNTLYWFVNGGTGRFSACEPHSTAILEMTGSYSNYGFYMPYNDTSLGDVTIVQGSTVLDHYIPYWE